MFDVFYFGEKPNLFVFEKPARDLVDAAKQAKTRFFWYIYGGNDYTGFNFDYTPVPWQSQFTHVWADQSLKNQCLILPDRPFRDVVQGGRVKPWLGKPSHGAPQNRERPRPHTRSGP